MLVNIRRPHKTDVGHLKELFEETINDIFDREKISDDQLKQGEIDEKMEFLLEDLNSNGKNRYFLVATVDGKIAGTIAVGKSNELITEATKGKLDEVVEIGTVYVHPNYQKLGIGMKMMNAMYITLLREDITEFCMDSGYKSAQAIWTRKIGKPEYVNIDCWGEGNHHMVWHKQLEDIDITL